jgi:hypothetical protein
VRFGTRRTPRCRPRLEPLIRRRRLQMAAIVFITRPAPPRRRTFGAAASLTRDPRRTATGGRKAGAKVFDRA